MGGTGFIGSEIVKHFATRNDDVISFSRNPPLKKNKVYKVNYINGDLNEKDKLYALTKDVDIIFHCGGSSTPSSIDLDANEELNTKNLVEASFYNDVKKFIFFSSGGAIYGNNENKFFKETDTPKPISKYGKTKLRTEKLLLDEFHNNKNRILILRPSNPYGTPIENKKKQGVIPIFLKLLSEDRTIKVFGDGSTIKDYIHISDLIKIIHNLTLNSNYGIYNIGSGIQTSINDLVSMMFRITKKQPKVTYNNSFKEDVNFALCTKKVYKNQSHNQLISLEEGISRLWNESYLKK